ncbi:long-chain fatty acid--CoA ligase [Sphingomonas gilva]|uniref:3-methylmercaptopropionyl-CoA ligase n=2 Tax=Sphingomonas gilva TaxID=2305907 RepID=A0A396RKA9_9SPHN|nr:long-chain fatty acid--CoA ligase [Sphingomonas gilva]
MERSPMSGTAPAWPAASLTQIQDILCAPGARFEMETVDIRGIPTRTWKNAPPNMTALVMLSRMHGARLATIYEDERTSYEAQYRAIAALAADLIAGGVQKGDRVAIAMRNLPEWPVSFFATVVTGAIAVPLNAWWTGEELAYGLADSGAKVLICDCERYDRIEPHRGDLPDLARVIASRCVGGAPDGVEELENIIGPTSAWLDLPADRGLPQVAIAPEDDATILYTSGTTGKPKGALGTHRNFMTNIFSSAYVAARTLLRRGEPIPDPVQKVGLTVIPLFHATALSAGLMGAMAAGHTSIYMRKWDVIRAFEIIERERVNTTGGVPTIAWQMLEHPDREKYDLSSLEAVGYGGAPSAPELVRKIVGDFKAMPTNGWGMTETTATVTTHAAEDYLNRPDSCGPAVPVSDLKIMDVDGREELPVGAVGELWARGPQIVKCYWNKPEETAETFVDGWVRTGDLARLDEEGFCYIVDRAKDMIIRGGENIYCVEVENILYEHPAVTDAALIGLPHKTLGEEPAAVVHLAPGAQATEAELQTLVRQHLAAFKVPVKILFSAETLPRNANGKILKPEVKKMFEAELV